MLLILRLLIIFINEYFYSLNQYLKIHPEGAPCSAPLNAAVVSKAERYQASNLISNLYDMC
jgi:hypothetical protein